MKEKIMDIVREYDLRIAVSDCRGSRHEIGFGSGKSRYVFDLFSISLKNSKRKVKKEMKKFLRNYIKEQTS